MLSLGLSQPDSQPSPLAGDRDFVDEANPFAPLHPPPLRARRPAVIVSGIAHVLSALSIAALVRGSLVTTAPTPAASPVFLPPLEARSASLAQPPPWHERASGRISIGAPAPEKRELALRPEDDLTQAPRGEPLASGTEGQLQPEPVPESPVPAEPPPVDLASGPGGGEPLPARLAAGSAIAGTRRASSGRWGNAASGQAGMGLQFDPEGADFSRWMQQFKNEVYRNWVAPESTQPGQVRLGFVVERSGAIAALTTLSGSGIAALDRAARDALAACRLLPLPDGYRPSQISIRVTINYGPPPEARGQAPQ